MKRSRKPMGVVHGFAVVLLSAVAIDAAEPAFADDNGGITLPEGFRAVVVKEATGPARHLTVRSNGDIYVAMRRPHQGGGIVALRDTDGDARADVVNRFGKKGGTGIRIYKDHLYFAHVRGVLRYSFQGDALVPDTTPAVVVRGFPRQRSHADKPITFDDSGRLYVNVGAPSNACQENPRTPGSPGIDPCPQLERQAGIWRFPANRLNQDQSDGQRFATGIRQSVAMRWSPRHGELYVVQHGRDQLHSLWPDLFTEEQNAELPGEEFLLVREGDNFGWPYCYYDHLQGKRVLAPEYGGDGAKVGRCNRFKEPILAFPGHWAPNDLLFYEGTQFPARFRGGAFIAFHGSWNRAPLPQKGFKVVFVPFEGKQPVKEWEVFADGFAGREVVRSVRDAEYRPMGLAEGPDGSLYIADSRQGRIWRVMYTGK
ncbi:MAG: PQQ-dependent sugar dehydrogenase [Verrucomicrobiota bacterium]